MVKWSDLRMPNAAHKEMSERWDPINALNGGTVRMRAEREKWLPLEDKETQLEYERRLRRTILFGAYPDTIDRLAGKPFSRSVTVDGVTDERIVGIIENADRAGRSLHDVAKDSFIDGCNFGLSFLLVDPPTTTGDESRKAVIEDRLYPAIIPICPTDLFDWSFERSRMGLRLTMIKILETVEGKETHRDGERIRVYKAGSLAGVSPDGQEIPATMASWEVYKRPENDDDDDAELVESGEASFSEIPLIAWYTKRDGAFRAKPPLEQLAWTNITHWQVSSDERNLVRFASVGQLAATGINEEDVQKLDTAAPSRILHANDKDAKFYVVEANGAAIGAIHESLRQLENRMEVLGMRPMIERTADTTATAVGTTAGSQMTLLQSWIRSCEIALTMALNLVHSMMKAPIPKDLNVDIFSDFRAVSAGQQDLPSLAAARNLGDIGRRVHVMELQRRGVLSEDLDPDDVVREAEEESVASMERFAGFGDPLKKPEDDKETDPENGDGGSGSGSGDDPAGRSESGEES